MLLKILRGLLLGCLLLILVACSHNNHQINVISREIGSGTRAAFVEILGVEDEFGDDNTTVRAVVQNSTNGVMQLVAGDKSAIGYISFGSLNDRVKTISIDHSAISEETLLSGAYPLARPFNVAWPKDKENELVQDFLSFIHSNDGQMIVEELGFVRVSDGQVKTYQVGTPLSGTIQIVGSTSVMPVIERLSEAYRELNPKVNINITSNGSSAGIEATMNGVADLAMASRALTDKEQVSLMHDVIALDGIAIIANPENTIDNLTIEQLRNIFQGKITNWEQIK